ncbi:MAG TPA: hypothetical protein DDZ80_12885 [Cyanobacteria bacterium UBA8803]|nr:hypothetical protein [Cyanobacteria bacterium UBA9273]HBL59370.1 hypothetical protein [Cyanobacteria bacterium UBA8803]
MARKFLILLMSLTLCWTTLACSSPPPRQSANPTFNNNTSATTRLSDGKYPVQQVTYDDATGEYTVMLLDTPPGTPPVFSTANLRLARLTDAEIAAGEKTYLSVNNGQADMHLTEDFRIEYVHNVTETQTNPQTGQPETVIVRQQSNFWTPFAGALAGQALGSLLFRPTYYVPPVYQPGRSMIGFGGYGSTYNQAVERYQTRYKAPPPVVQNRRAFRTTGTIRRNPSTSIRRTSPNSNRSTGSGVGSSTLRRSGKSSPTRTRRSTGFGSGSRRSTGFGSRRSVGGRRR